MYTSVGLQTLFCNLKFNLCIMQLDEWLPHFLLRSSNCVSMYMYVSIQDPSRNHKVLRAYQSKLLPPVIPFMPLVSKDAYFLNVANETFVDKLVNFEKMRLVASSVRALTTYRTASISAEAKMLANKNPSLQQYFR